MLVDDDFDDRELFVEALSLVDRDSTIIALDGSEGLIGYLDTLDKLPDYIFLDLNMPRKSGKECLREINAIAGTGNEPPAEVDHTGYTVASFEEDVTLL